MKQISEVSNKYDATKCDGKPTKKVAKLDNEQMHMSTTGIFGWSLSVFICVFSLSWLGY